MFCELQAGGHHDAGDYGKYVINSGSFVGWLMNALEVLGAENDDLPLPEAGDGIPDIVQVCLWVGNGRLGGLHTRRPQRHTAGDLRHHTLMCKPRASQAC